MTTARRYTSADLERLPEVEGTRYEIIAGELHVTTQPHAYHQRVCTRAAVALQNWNDQTGAGEAIFAPGLVFAADDDVAPDVVWISRARLEQVMDASGHLRAAPELVVEVLSPGTKNVRRDREAKLQLYSRQGVREYWIVDWRARTVDVYRREREGLQLVATLVGQDLLSSPLLPGFACPLAYLWGTSG